MLQTFKTLSSTVKLGLKKEETGLEKFRRQFDFSRLERLVLKGKIKGLSAEVVHIKKDIMYGLSMSELIRAHMLAYAFLRKVPYKVVEGNSSNYKFYTGQIKVSQPRPIYPCQVFKIIEQSARMHNVTNEAVREWFSEE